MEQNVATINAKYLREARKQLASELAKKKHHQNKELIKNLTQFINAQENIISIYSEKMKLEK